MFLKRIPVLLSLVVVVALQTNCAVRPHVKGGSAPKNKALVTKSLLQVAPEGGSFSRKSYNPAQAITPDYLLGYGDVLEVKFFNNPEYNEQVTVRPDGKISLQRIGDVQVVGMTPNILTGIVTDAYKEILVDPDVTVFVRQFGGQEVYVLGEVNKAGNLPIAKGMTILRAIAAAGGPKETAKMNSVLLIRHGEMGVEATRINVDLGELTQNPQSDLTIQPYDMIYVPRSFIADVDLFISKFYNVILPPIDLYTRYKILSRWN